MEPRQVFRTYEAFAEADLERLKQCRFCDALLSTMADGRQRSVCPSCGQKSFRNPSPAISVLVVDENDRFLLTRRRVESFQGGKWCLPCGYVEFAEDYLTAAIREVKEETNLDVEITALLSVVSNFFTPEMHTIVIVLLAQPVSTDPIPGDDADKVEWFLAPEALPEMAFEADSHIIRRYFEAKLQGAPIDPRYGRPSRIKPPI